MQSMDEIYKLYSKTVYNYLFCLTNDEDISEDLTQETFVIAVKEISKFKGNCKVSVWLCQIAKHLWYKQLKRKSNKNISIEEIDKEILSDYSTEDIILNKETKLQVFKDLQLLDEKTREVIYLRMIGNLSFKEIAEILGKTPSWARVVFYRGKQKIKEVNESGKEN